MLTLVIGIIVGMVMWQCLVFTIYMTNKENDDWCAYLLTVVPSGLVVIFYSMPRKIVMKIYLKWFNKNYIWTIFYKSRAESITLPIYYKYIKREQVKLLNTAQDKKYYVLTSEKQLKSTFPNAQIVEKNCTNSVYENWFKE